MALDSNMRVQSRIPHQWYLIGKMSVSTVLLMISGLSVVMSAIGWSTLAMGAFGVVPSTLAGVHSVLMMSLCTLPAVLVGFVAYKSVSRASDAYEYYYEDMVAGQVASVKVGEYGATAVVKGTNRAGGSISFTTRVPINLVDTVEPGDPYPWTA